MAMFSKACEYGIRAVIYIAGESLKNNRVSLKDIAKEIDSPVAFTAKILQQLVRYKILESVKGPSGGFEMDKAKMDEIKLAQVVKAIDGDAVFTTCGLGLKVCSEKQPCPVHDRFKAIRENLKHMLETTTMRELSTGLKDGLTYLRQ